MIEMLAFSLFHKIQAPLPATNQSFARKNILISNVLVLNYYYHSYANFLFLVTRDDLISKLVEENKVSFEVGECRGILSFLHKVIFPYVGL